MLGCEFAVGQVSPVRKTRERRNGFPAPIQFREGKMSATEGGAVSWKSGRSKGGCVNLIVQIRSKCGQGRGGGEKIQKCCGYHNWKPPNVYASHLCVRSRQRRRLSVNFQSRLPLARSLASFLTGLSLDSTAAAAAAVCPKLMNGASHAHSPFDSPSRTDEEPYLE